MRPQIMLDPVGRVDELDCHGSLQAQRRIRHGSQAGSLRVDIPSAGMPSHG